MDFIIRPKDSRQASTAKTSKTRDDGPSDTNNNETSIANERWVNSVLFDTGLFGPPPIKSCPGKLERTMVKKDLSLAQMCSFYRAAGSK